jgi:hypothetical protein
MGKHRQRRHGINVVDTPENVSPTGAQIDESDMEDTLTSAKEKPPYEQRWVMRSAGL